MNPSLDPSEHSALDAAPASRLQRLCTQLRDAAVDLDRSGKWPENQLRWCVEAGLFGWFVPERFGGQGWSEQALTEVYLEMSRACLTTTFVLTQWNAACKRLVGSDNEELKQRLLPAMAAGSVFATVGISHLSTSRQHLGRPVLVAETDSQGGYVLSGISPWVTGSAHADVIVTGATLPDGRQIMAAVPTDAAGVRTHPGLPLVALTSSCTDKVEFDAVRVSPRDIVAGPVENVLATNSGGGTGGLQTSTVALGLTRAAVDFLLEQAAQRPDLQPVADRLAAECTELTDVLFQLTAGQAAGT
ncbi:MAG: acyl-CoA dehydrogenase, partial [Planctomycetota bacterium]